MKPFEMPNCRCGNFDCGRLRAITPLSMKRAFLIIFWVVVADATGGESDYLSTIKSAHERLNALEVERSDYRKVKPNLSQAEEDERLRLLGQLSVDDPVWALTQQLIADVSALVALQPKTENDVLTL